MRVNMHDAKTNLSRLVAAVESGEADEIEIARAGHVVARIVPPGSAVAPACPSPHHPAHPTDVRPPIRPLRAPSRAKSLSLGST